MLVYQRVLVHNHCRLLEYHGVVQNHAGPCSFDFDGARFASGRRAWYRRHVGAASVTVDRRMSRAKRSSAGGWRGSVAERPATSALPPIEAGGVKNREVNHGKSW